MFIPLKKMSTMNYSIILLHLVCEVLKIKLVYLVVAG